MNFRKEENFLIIFIISALAFFNILDIVTAKDNITFILSIIHAAMNFLAIGLSSLFIKIRLDKTLKD